MTRLMLAAFAVAALPVLAAAQDTGEPAPAPDRGYEVRQQVGSAARETGRVLRRGWEGTKEAAHKAGNALERGWHTIESGIRWGWNHPNGRDAPPQADSAVPR